MSDMTLLPANATKLEKSIALQISKISDIPVPFKSLYDFTTCPIEVLPWLAWDLRVEFWSSDWSRSKKRAACAESRVFNESRGTRSALHYALKQLNTPYVLTVWHELNPQGQPYTFTVKLPNKKLTITDLESVHAFIDPAKSARDQYSVQATVTTGTLVFAAGIAKFGAKVLIETKGD